MHKIATATVCVMVLSAGCSRHEFHTQIADDSRQIEVVAVTDGAATWSPTGKDEYTLTRGEHTIVVTANEVTVDGTQQYTVPDNARTIEVAIARGGTTVKVDGTAFDSATN